MCNTKSNAPFLPAVVLTTFLSAAFAQTGTPGIPIVDQFMAGVMNTYGVLGASVAITHNGQLILARGYGLMDQANNVPTQPDTLYRIASCSKTITAVAIMHLVEQGKLDLDQPAFAVVPDLQAPGGQDKDPRLATITIRELLEHSGGWNPNLAGFDPVDNQVSIAGALGVPSPASSDNMVRYMRGQDLQYNPGEDYNYYDFGYDLLARIIDRVSGMSYEQYVRTNVFAPMGITNARIAQTLVQGQLPGETNYYASGKQPNIFPNATPKNVSPPYGVWYMEGFDGDGGWVISAIDYAKFINAIDGQRGNRFLSPSTVATMTARPNIPYWVGQPDYYALGMVVQPTANGQLWWHTGAINGTFTYYFRTDNGFVWTVFMNAEDRESALQNAVINWINNLMSQVTAWPATDYFVNYPDADPTQAALQPAINTSEGVRNAATFDRGIVPGSWATLLGVNLSRTTRGWTDSDFVNGALPTSLDGVSVMIDGKRAAVSYISPTQINAQVPDNVKPGWVTVQVTTAGVNTSKVLTWTTNNNPGAFTYSQNGITYAVATRADGSQVNPAAPAQPGDVISLYATGLEVTHSGVVSPAQPDLSTVGVTIGGQPATVQYAGLVAAGLFQINVVVPAVAAGKQPLYIDSSYIPSPAGVALPVAASTR